MNDPVNRPLPESRVSPAHELTDVSPISIGLFALGLAFMIAVVLPLLGWIFWGLEAAAKRSDVPQSPLVDSPTFREPKLQAQPAADLARFRDDENHRLSSYAWIDRQRGVVRVPIEFAIRILAERGFPEPPGPAEPAKKRDLTP